MLTLTELEFEVMREVCFSDHASDGNGLGGWFGRMQGHDGEWMKRARGAISSLVKKGVVGVSDEWFNNEKYPTSWIGVRDEYQEQLEEFEGCGILSEMFEWTGYILINVDVSNWESE